VSSFSCDVGIIEIFDHPNADALSCAKMQDMDYVFVVAKDQFKTGDKVVYIPEQAILPDALIEEMGLVGRLSGGAKNRVKAIRLRGELSQGLAYRPTEWPEHWVLGTDVTEELGITKWEPEMRFHGGPNAHKFNADHVRVTGSQIFHGYTDIENGKKFPYVFEDGELVFVQSKLHGSNCLLGIVGDDQQEVVSSLGVTKREHAALKFEPDNPCVYWKMAKQYNIHDKLRLLIEQENLLEVICN